MSKLKDSFKRGRPDIVHFALMEALGTPLFLKGILRVHVHTVDDKLIGIADNLRIPKSYSRFEGLMVNLLRDKIIKSDEGAVLMEIFDGTLADLLDAIKPHRVVGLSTTGVQGTAEKAVAENLADDCAFVVGGFPKGHFSQWTTQLLNRIYSISEIGLEAHIVIARLLYECEKILLEKGVHYEGNEKRRQIGT
jgi:rRNA small subunit pseudouridine methyltransferase Nep1